MKDLPIVSAPTLSLLKFYVKKYFESSQTEQEKILSIILCIDYDTYKKLKSEIENV